MTDVRDGPFLVSHNILQTIQYRMICVDTV